MKTDYLKYQISTIGLIIGVSVSGCGGSSSSTAGDSPLPKDAPVVATLQLNAPAANMRVDLSNRSDILISGICSNDGVAVDLSVVDSSDATASIGSVVCNSHAFSYHADLSNLKLGANKIVATHTKDASASVDIRYVPFQLVSGLTDHGSSSAARPGDASTYNNAQVFDGPISASGRYAFFVTNASNLGFALTTKVQILRKDLTTGEIIVVSSGPSGFANDHAMAVQTSADGNIVIFQSAATNLTSDASDGSVHYFKKDLTTGAITKFADASIDGNLIRTPLKLSADGRYVGALVIQYHSDLYRIDLQTSAREKVDIIPGTPPTISVINGIFDMSSDGMTFVFKTRVNGIQIRHMNEASAQPLVNIPPDSLNLNTIALSGDAKTLTFFTPIQDVIPSAAPMTVPDLFQLNIETMNIQLLTSTDGTEANRVLGDPYPGILEVSYDGRFVHYTDNPVQYFTPRLDTKRRAIRKDVMTKKLEMVSSFDELSTPAGLQQGGVRCSADGKVVTTLGTGGSGTLINGNLNLTQILVRQFK